MNIAVTRITNILNSISLESPFTFFDSLGQKVFEVRDRLDKPLNSFVFYLIYKSDENTYSFGYTVHPIDEELKIKNDVELALAFFKKELQDNKAFKVIEDGTLGLPKELK